MLASIPIPFDDHFLPSSLPHSLLRSNSSPTLSRASHRIASHPCLLILSSSITAISLSLSTSLALEPLPLSILPVPASIAPLARYSSENPNLHPLVIQQYKCCALRNVVPTRAFDGDSFDIPMFDDWNADESSSAYVFSSDGEDSDGEVFLTPVNDVDLPSVSASNSDALTVAAHRFATLGRGRTKPRQSWKCISIIDNLVLGSLSCHLLLLNPYKFSFHLCDAMVTQFRTKLGFFITLGLITVLTLLHLYVDWCAWRIVRLPLSPFYLTRPFLISAILVSVAGYVCVPIFRHFKIIHVIKQQGPARHSMKKRTPTLGGLLFIPFGIIVTHVFAGSSSIEVSGASGVTIAFAAVGLLSDVLSLTKNHWRSLPALTEILLEVAVGTWFSFWLDITSISSPYGMKMLVPLPLGLVYLGRYYQFLTSFCFVSMGHGVKITDTLDGLAGGTAALAFTGMSIAVLPICSDSGAERPTPELG
ncbi:Phospho-N-acetylmuramoyl-pentapeptide-transferase-like protein, partial [Mucuna pruriens]